MAWAQTDSIPAVTPVIAPIDSLSIPESKPDSIVVEGEGGIQATIFYNADDSIIIDLVDNIVRLYGNAFVKYEDLELTAAYIEYSFSENRACASGVADTLGVLTGKPALNQGGQSFSQEYLCYNFITQKGYSKAAITQEGDAIFHAGISKRHSNGTIHIGNGKFTTCDAENPHYHFHLKKAIIIPDDKVVSGPLYMKIRKVPTPLALPFGWFPTKNESSHGVILPGYGNADQLGFFLKDGGYYIPLGRHADTRILADIYSRGSWSLRNLTNYKFRYRSSGTFDVSRTVLKQGFAETPGFSKNTQFFVRWNHDQDPKARPNSRFSARINFGSSNNFRNNLNSSQTDYLSNTFASSVQYNRSFPGKPYNLTVGARQSQNSATGNVEIILPSVTLNRARTNLPISSWFGNKGPKKKIDQIGFTYSANFENYLSARSSVVRWDEIGRLQRQVSNGIRHTAALTTQAKMGFVTFTPSFNYNEYWAFKEVTVNQLDNGAFEKDTIPGFITARDWRLSGSFNTRFYGTFNFRKTENLKAIRHVITPQAGVSYVPAISRAIFGYFGDDGDLSSYTPFDAARFRPGDTREQFNVNFSMANNLEMKVRDKEKGGRATKKVKLIENYVITGSYNMLADSLNLSDISMRGFTTLFRNVTINVSSTHTAYNRDEDGRLINSYLAENGRLLRMKRASAAMGLSFRGTGQKVEKPKDVPEEQLEQIEQNRNDYVDFSVPWSINLNYSLNLNKVFVRELQADTNAVTQSILFTGDVTVFKRWKIGVNSGYDLVAKELTPTTLNLYWDLHCWELTFNYIPFGFRKSFSIQLNVKSSLLKDLKLQARGGPNGLLF
ncbi:MAG: hypothetical protein RL226_875 [Bacteroidota bacterium]